jgi:hypothetical protein
MIYRFHRCQPHLKLPNLTGWYLELRPGDFATLMDLHLGVTAMYYSKFGTAPVECNERNIGTFVFPKVNAT